MSSEQHHVSKLLYQESWLCHAARRTFINVSQALIGGVPSSETMPSCRDSTQKVWVISVVAEASGASTRRDAQQSARCRPAHTTPNTHSMYERVSYQPSLTLGGGLGRLFFVPTSIVISIETASDLLLTAVLSGSKFIAEAPSTSFVAKQLLSPTCHGPCTYGYICINMCVYTYMYIYIYIYIYMHIHMYTYSCICLYMHICAYAHVIHMYMYMYMHMHIYIYIYIYIFTPLRCLCHGGTRRKVAWLPLDASAWQYRVCIIV